MKVLPASPEAYRLLHEGALALAEMTRHGMRVDVPYLEGVIASTEEAIRSNYDRMKSDPLYLRWRRMHGAATKLGSRQQLAKLLFGKAKEGGLGYKSKGRTRTDQDSMKKDDLAHLRKKEPLVKLFLEAERLRKRCGTYLKGLRRETVDGFVHQNINVHLADTYRSCVAKGTMIETVRDISKDPKGVPIESVSAGDYVYCYDKQLKLVVRKVLWAGKTGHRRIVRVHWKGKLSRGGFLDVTPEHKIRLVDGKYVRADKLMEIEDCRPDWVSPRTPKVAALSLSRKSRSSVIYITNQKSVLDHRLVYSCLIGPLNDDEVVHHKDRNHYNNLPSNLQKMTPSSHASHHVKDNFTDAAIRKGHRARVENHRKYGDRWPSGPDSPNWIHISRYALLRMLASVAGSPTKIPHDFELIKKRAFGFGIDLVSVRDRYDRDGRYISRGRIRSEFDGKIGTARRVFGINYQKAQRMLAARGIPFQKLGKPRNPNGRRGSGNHRIVSVEFLNTSVDVYDLEVEECHNFIANEICVHNSEDTPNLQNIIVRDAEGAKVIRRSLIPRPGCRIVVADQSALEFRAAAWRWKDPALIAYAGDPSKDIHRDMAIACYLLDEKRVRADSQTYKLHRYNAKNKFVFPVLYGSYWRKCAAALWQAAGSKKMKVEGIPLREWMGKRGIDGLGNAAEGEKPERGTFEHHIRGLEFRFFDMFPTFHEGKKKEWEEYLERGYFTCLTGFVFSGLNSRNELLNFPQQSIGFHCILWAIPRIQAELRKKKMKALLVNEVHDDVMGDVPENELQDYLEIVRRVMTKDVRDHWPWICTPLEIEVSVSELAENGGSWADMRPWKD